MCYLLLLASAFEHIFMNIVHKLQLWIWRGHSPRANSIKQSKWSIRVPRSINFGNKRLNNRSINHITSHHIKEWMTLSINISINQQTTINQSINQSNYSIIHHSCSMSMSTDDEWWIQRFINSWNAHVTRGRKQKTTM
jgi:hypothetical protein